MSVSKTEICASDWDGCPPSLDYRFVLPFESLNDPATNRGEVVDTREIPPVDEYGRELPTGVRLFETYVQDPFVAADPDNYLAVREYISRIEAASLARGMNFMDRTEAVQDGERNEFTRAWLSDPSVDSLSIWRSLVPTAEALHYLTNPMVGASIADRHGHSGVISPETAAHLRFVEDSIGIRDRGVAMAHLLRSHFAESGQTRENVLSLASGTAEPVLLAAKEAIDATGKEVSITVADIDDRSLDFVRENARNAGVAESVTPLRTNILGKKFASKLVDKTGIQQWDIVENMGFEEYLPQDGDEMKAKRGEGLPPASVFTRNAFELVKPGGVLISGNMVFERPQRDFVFGIVDWPLINARSEQSIMRVYEQAGLLANPNVQVDMFRVINSQTGTHIYNIISAKKNS